MACLTMKGMFEMPPVGVVVFYGERGRPDDVDALVGQFEQLVRGGRVEPREPRRGDVSLEGGVMEVLVRHQIGIRIDVLIHADRQTIDGGNGRRTVGFGKLAQCQHRVAVGNAGEPGDVDVVYRLVGHIQPQAGLMMYADPRGTCIAADRKVFCNDLVDLLLIIEGDDELIGLDRWTGRLGLDAAIGHGFVDQRERQLFVILIEQQPVVQRAWCRGERQCDHVPAATLGFPYPGEQLKGPEFRVVLDRLFEPPTHALEGPRKILHRHRKHSSLLGFHITNTGTLIAVSAKHVAEPPPHTRANAE